MEGLYEYWFALPPKKWFDGSIDKEIQTKFLRPFNEFIGSELSDPPTDKKGLLEWILSLDQIPRHFRRLEIPVPIWVDDKAYELAQIFRNRYLTEDNLSDVTIPEVLFGLLPIRHRNDFNEVTELIHLWNWIQPTLSDPNFEVWRKAQQANIEKWVGVMKLDYPAMPDNTKELDAIKKDLEDGKTDSYRKLCVGYEDILDPDTTFDQQLQRDYTIRNNRISAAAQSMSWDYENETSRNYFVLLSGGVDSMTILNAARVASYIRQQVVALHINYNNREESTRERDFLIQMCYLWGVTLYVIDIDWMKRDGPLKREWYEKVTRNIKFKGCDILMRRHECFGAILGHHKGDLAENVFTNLMYGRSLLDLPVINRVTEVDGIVFHRPLIHTSKKEIFRLAHLTSIPYFKNTTPEWSKRGKMREELFPLMKNIFGDGCIDRLYDAGIQSYALSRVFDDHVVKPMIDSCVTGKLGWGLKYTDFQGVGFDVWTKLFHHHYSLLDDKPLPKKIMRQLYERIISYKIFQQTIGKVVIFCDYQWFLMMDARILKWDRWKFMETIATTEEVIRMDDPNTIYKSLVNGTYYQPCIADTEYYRDCKTPKELRKEMNIRWRIMDPLRGTLPKMLPMTMKDGPMTVLHCFVYD